MSLFTLDLHGVRHHEVGLEVENFVFLNQEHAPLIIICGNSARMIELVSNFLDKHKIEYYPGKGFDYGRITIFKI